MDGFGEVAYAADEGLGVDVASGGGRYCCGLGAGANWGRGFEVGVVHRYGFAGGAADGGADGG